MARSTTIWTNFTAGELSPRLEGRVDLEKYFNGVRSLTNFMVHPHGGATRRPGTIFVAECKYDDRRARLIPFVFNEQQAYVLEMGDQYIRYFVDGAPVYASGSTLLETTTPYQVTGSTNQVAEVKFAQSADVMYLAHPEVEPMQLSRTGAASFTLTTITFTGATSAWRGATGSTPANWPGAVGFFEQRSVWAGAPDNPQTVWLSVSGDYTNMSVGTAADDALEYTLAADSVNRIRWVCAHKRLILGTVGAEWSAGAASSLEPITPDNVRFERESTYGSADIQGKLIDRSVLFCSLHGKKLYEFGYNFEADGYVARDLTLLAEHITGDGIIEFTYAPEPDSHIWAVRSDGVALIGCYYPRENVMAWSRFETDGQVESVCVVPGNGRDQLYMIVARQINGQTKRYVEMLADPAWSEVRDAFYVDCGLTYHDAHQAIAFGTGNPMEITLDDVHGWSPGDYVYLSECTGSSPLAEGRYTLSTGTTGSTITLADVDGSTVSMDSATVERMVNVLTGLDHLEGKSVQILADGAAHPSRTVSGGQVSLQYYVRKAHVGLGYTSTLQTMRSDFGARDGTAQAKKSRVIKAAIRFYNTVGAKVGVDEGDLETIPFRSTSDPMDEPIPPFSGDKVVPLKGGWGREGRVTVQQDLPLPMTILSIVAQLLVEDL